VILYAIVTNGHLLELLFHRRFELHQRRQPCEQNQGFHSTFHQPNHQQSEYGGANGRTLLLHQSKLSLHQSVSQGLIFDRVGQIKVQE